MKTQFYRGLCMALITSCCAFHIPAQAQMLPTESMVEVSSARAEVQTFLQRADVIAAMEQQGVSLNEVQARVAAMSDAEIQTLQGRIHDMPAGGDILGLVFTVFIILLITDILGFTKIFPFTRSIR